MARFKDKSRLLELLAETPVVSFACKKVGLDRTTYYRWYKDDKDFREKADQILTIGRKSINDKAEASIIQKIHDGDMRANIFWLQHNDERYRPIRTSYIPPAEHPHNLRPGETCRSCGYKEPSTETKGKSINNDKLSEEIYRALHLSKKKKASKEDIKKILDKIILDNQEDQFQVQWVVVDGSKRDDEDEKD